MRLIQRGIVLGAVCLGVAMVSLTGGCVVHHHPPEQTEYVDVHGYHHVGYYDEHHDWHGGYYDEHHEYHDDPHDWHQ